MHPQSLKAGLSPSLKARTSKALSFALAFCLVCPSMPVFAAEDDEAALARAEKILFGNDNQSGDFAERLVQVEKRIFGRKKGGSDEERVERITSTLLIDRKKLKVTRKPEAKPVAGEEKSGTAETKQAAVDEKAGAVETKQATVEARPADPVAQASPVPPQEPSSTNSASATPSEPTAEVSKEATSSAKDTVKDIAKQFGEEFAKDTSLQPEAKVAHEAPTKAKPAKGNVQKGKKKAVARRAGKQPVTASSKATEKKPEVTLTAETAALDARKVEKRPSSLETPVTYSSSSSNRISRVSAPKVSQATALLREGMEAHRKGEDAKAEQLFKKVVTLEPRNPDGYYNLGALAEKKKDLAGALMSYRAALTLTPNDRELQDAVDSVESQLGVEPTGSTMARESGRSASGHASHGGSGTHAASSRSSSSQSYSASEGTSGADREAEEVRRAEIREYYGRSSDRENSDQEYGSRESVARRDPFEGRPRPDPFESSDRSASQSGAYGFGPNHRSAHNGPQPAPSYYRARAKTTREIQEENAPYADVNDPDAPMMTVGSPPPPVANANQPQPFQLQTQRNQAAAQAAQRKGPSAAGIATRALLGVALSVGTSYALRSTGMHCPVCRIGGGGGALRGLLRF